MNGNIYVKLSYDILEISTGILSQIEESLANDLKPFFGMSLKVNVIDNPSARKVEVFIMDKAKYPDHDESIKEQVKNVLTSRVKTLSQEMIDVKINYAQFNPKFDPTVGLSPCPQKVKSSKQNDTLEGIEEAEKSPKRRSDEFDYEKLSLNYTAVEPRYSFDQVILPPKTLEQIERAIGIIEVESKVFDEWGLRSIIPTASSALSFYGLPGTGKSIAAEAIAKRLGKKILSATYADIESKFHGEGPKMVKAIFMAAERDNAVLFLDESDSLLSKRLTNVSDGSAQAINSMRSQLLISLERFKGIVIFATNLVVNYDKAFLSRLINIEFTMPTADERERIWVQHLSTDRVHVPLSGDVNIRFLADNYEFCGREIKSAVKSACISAALEKRDKVTQSDFIKACEITKEETLKVINASDHTVSHQPSISNAQKNTLIDVMQKRLDSQD